MIISKKVLFLNSSYIFYFISKTFSMKIWIILWYWILNDNDDRYKSYLDKILLILKNKDFDKIILCWGFTKVGLNISEAYSMSQYIISKESFFENKIILEEQSFTTFENILFASKIIDKFKNVEISILCDSIRLPKVVIYTWSIIEHRNKKDILKLLSKYMVEINILNNYHIKIWGINYEWISMNRTDKEIGDQIVWSIIQSYYTDYPDLHEDFLIYRKKKWWFIN